MTYQYDPDTAMAHLAGTDNHLAWLFAAVGRYRMRQETNYSPFQSLLRAIVYQHVSTHSAEAVHQRLRALFAYRRAKPEALLALDEPALRAAGLPRAKILAVRDLALRTLAGEIPGRRKMETMTDKQIIDELTKVRGIGPWTVEMFLLFRLGRPDVLPVGDLGVRRGFGLLHELAQPPSANTLLTYGERWRPYRSVATWYLWRANDCVDWSRAGSVRNAVREGAGGASI